MFSLSLPLLVLPSFLLFLRLVLRSPQAPASFNASWLFSQSQAGLNKKKRRQFDNKAVETSLLEPGKDAGLCGLPLQALKLCVTFLTFFLLLLLLLGSIKAVLICPVVATIIFFGNSAVVICLWPAHFIWTYYCVLKTERIGLVLKIFAALLLPFLLFLSPILAIAGSLLVGVGYGVFAPLMATFEAVGEGFTDKLTHCFFGWHC